MCLLMKAFCTLYARMLVAPAILSVKQFNTGDFVMALSRFICREEAT